MAIVVTTGFLLADGICPKVATSKVGGKARRLYDDMKKKHGLDTLSPEEYRVLLGLCLQSWVMSHIEFRLWVCFVPV